MHNKVENDKKVKLIQRASSEIFIGLNATIWDQYSKPVEKFEKAIEMVDEV